MGKLAQYNFLFNSFKFSLSRPIQIQSVRFPEKCTADKINTKIKYI